MNAVPSVSRRPSRWDGLRDALSDPQVICSLLIFYCLIHFLIRLFLSPNFSLDESEEVLFGQSFQWGYRFRNPPLITWLVWATLHATANSRVGFFVLKYAIMALGFIAFFAAGRHIIRDTKLAALATFGLMTTFVMGYLPHVNFMHAVSMASTTAGFLWAVSRILTTGKRTDYLLLGVMMGLGLLSKYIFGILLVTVAIAILFTPTMRARLRIPELIGALILAGIMVAPYALWSIENKFSLVTLAETASKSQGPSLNPLEWLKRVVAFAQTMFNFIAPFIPIFPFVYWRACMPLAPQSGDETDRAWLRVLGLSMLLAGIAMLVAIVYMNSDELNQRWMYPVLTPLPIWLFLRVKLTGASERQHAVFLAIAALFALGIIIARPVVYWTDAAHCKKCREYWPMQTLAQSVHRAGFDHGTILAEPYDFAGNIRAVFPDSRVVTPGYPVKTFGPPIPGPCLLLWRDQNAPQKDLIAYLQANYGAGMDQAALRGDVVAPLLTSKKRFDTMSYAIIQKGRCAGP